MELPLYWTSSAPSKLPEDAHRGLWFDKFCSYWTRGEDGSMEMGEGKLRWLKSLAGACGDRKQLEATALRRIDLVESRGGRWGVFASDSRFVTGLGLSNPSENGFAWHPTLGVPFLPGSTIKGMVRAFSQLPEGVFGEGESAGTVAFLDAVPTSTVTTEVDVLTPHYAGWTEVDLPGDWRSPIPVPFLTVARGQKFLFSIVPASSDTEGEQADIDEVWNAIRSALGLEGVGAKTAVGYGFFEEDQRAEKALQKAREREAIERDPDSPAAVRADLRRRTEGELLTVAKEALASAEDLPDGRDPVMIASILDDQEFLEEWCAYWHDKGSRVECPESTFLSEWEKKRKVDPGTATGGKKLKERAMALRERVDES